VFAKLCVAVALASALGAAPTKREAALLQQKVDAIKAVKKDKRQRRTVITENELNAYFIFDAAKDLPIGVIKPAITIAGPGRVSGSAVVDLDAVRKASPPTSLLDPKNLLIGRVPLSATGVLTTNGGVGKFALESAHLGNLPLPKLLLDEIVSYYTRSAERPSGFTTDDSFMLPAGIRDIQVARGQAVVIQ
jgi:hypothetical protein